MGWDRATVLATGEWIGHGGVRASEIRCNGGETPPPREWAGVVLCIERITSMRGRAARVWGRRGRLRYTLRRCAANRIEL